MSDDDQTPDFQEPPLAPKAQLDRMLDKRPPLPPDPVDARWTWTRPKLKAVYLEAFTEMSKAEIAEALGADPKTLYKWRRAPDYRRYLAVLIAADGLADRAERVKARKNLAQSLGDAIAKKMKTPGALDGEKLSSLLRAQREMLDALQDDAESLRELGAEQDSAARAGQARPGMDLAERLAAIPDQAERDIVRKHLLKLMGEYMGTPKVLDAATVIDADAEEPEAEARAVSTPSAAVVIPLARPSSVQDAQSFVDAQGTAPTPSAPSAARTDSAPSVSGDDFAEG
jgi:transposase-like protein